MSRTKVRNSHVFSLDGGAEAWRWSLEGHGSLAHALTIVSPTPDGLEVASVRTHHSYRSDVGEVGAQAVLDSVTLNGVPVRVPTSE
ncbi:MAG: hypothetical protein AB8H79_01180 [Myxococcota bacterium]